MANSVIRVYLSYSQICIFLSSLSQPFNDWSDRNITQGFSWGLGSASFRALVDDCDHKINLNIDEHIPALADDIVWAFKVPLETSDGNIEIGSISDSNPIEVPAGVYSLQVELLGGVAGTTPVVNVRLNKGGSGFSVLKADDAQLTMH